MRWRQKKSERHTTSHSDFLSRDSKSLLSFHIAGVQREAVVSHRPRARRSDFRECTRFGRRVVRVESLRHCRGFLIHSLGVRKRHSRPSFVSSRKMSATPHRRLQNLSVKASRCARAVFPDKQTLPMSSAPSSAPRAYLSRRRNTTSVVDVCGAGGLAEL